MVLSKFKRWKSRHKKLRGERISVVTCLNIFLDILHVYGPEEDPGGGRRGGGRRKRGVSHLTQNLIFMGKSV